jgi:hypothetical protein
MKFNVPGRVIDFYTGGGAYQAWERDVRDSRDWPEADELALFEAVRDGRRMRPSKGGYYVRAELSDAALKGLRYWAETLQTASQDDASYEPDARNDLRAANKTLAKLGR